MEKMEALAKFFHQASLFFILDVFAVDRNLGFLFVFVNFGQRLLLVSNFFCIATTTKSECLLRLQSKKSSLNFLCST